LRSALSGHLSAEVRTQFGSTSIRNLSRRRARIRLELCAWICLPPFSCNVPHQTRAPKSLRRGFAEGKAANSRPLVYRSFHISAAEFPAVATDLKNRGSFASQTAQLNAGHLSCRLFHDACIDQAPPPLQHSLNGGSSFLGPLGFRIVAMKCRKNDQIREIQSRE
jgi:hypothetical protein